ncbi:MAG: hypothetical protein ACRD16_03845 [Thermoanaerobaculia bacterium]
MDRRVYAHRVRIDGNNRFAISAPEIGISESFDSEDDLETALGALGFPDGFGHDVVRALENRGIVWLDVDSKADLSALKRLSHEARRH